MANKPISKTLPADLPVDWTNNHYISSDGQELGLTTQYGYNYLNEQINEAQKGVNLINNAFEGLPTIHEVSASTSDSSMLSTSTSYPNRLIIRAEA